MEREAVLVGIDVGTSKVCALIGEVEPRRPPDDHGPRDRAHDGPASKGVVVNIDQTVRSIADAVERAERLSGWKIDRAFVGVGGQHVESLNSTGQVAVTAHHREVTREDISRAIEVARAVSIPSNRDVLHVERRGFTVDGQEGVKDPLGMSALRLEVETHIVTASATAVQNLTKCVQLAGRQDRRARRQRPRLGRGGRDRDREGAGRRGGRHRRRRRSTSRCSRTARRSTRPSCRSAATTSPTTSPSGVKTTLQVAEELKVRHGTCDLRAIEDEEISVSVLGEEAGRTVSRVELCQIIEARMRETFELLRGEMARSGHGMLPAGIILTGGASQLAGTAELGREVLQMPVRVAGPAGIGGLVDTIQDPVLLHGRGPAPVGRHADRDGRAAPLRVRAGRRRPGPDPPRVPLGLPLSRCARSSWRSGPAAPAASRTSPPPAPGSPPTRPRAVTGCSTCSSRTRRRASW